MGNICQSSEEITVATLNFSGINVNRFQYHDGSAFMEELDAKFKWVQENQFPRLMEKGWEGATFDKNYKTTRFTVLFGKEFIQRLGTKLFNKKEFEQQWMFFYNRAEKESSFERGYRPTVEEVRNVMLMDYTFYKVLVMTVYNFPPSFDQREFQTASSQLLKEKLEQFKDRATFSLDKKRLLVERYYQITDAMFLQEAGSVEWKIKKGYSSIKNHDSLIIYRQSIFGKPLEPQKLQWKQELDINQDTAFTFTDKGFLLISSHFRSNQKDYELQTKELQNILNKIATESQKSWKIILGIDANHFITTIPSTFIVPNSRLTPTSIKKRSFIQAQIKKAGKRVEEVKDHIVTTLPVTQFWIELVDGRDNQRQMLPNDEHPYDHFIVKARLSL